MPRRRRNADGSLVVPLSPKQVESLERGRRRLVELHGGALAEGSGGNVSKASDTAVPREPASGRRVETVRVSKATKKRAKASGPTARAVAKKSAPAAKETTPPPRKGWLERWVTET